ncbi:MAG TPA: RNA polymerase sigma factor [Anaerolineales bacterium]|nr:RNA polymerase sigma factor [Anaerolineales bacterium]
MATPTKPSDEDLVHAAQQGRQEAFNVLFERYLPLVHNRVRYVVPEQDAEDVTQEVFVAAIRSLRSFRGESLFSTWLRTLTNRQVADYYRRRKPSLGFADTNPRHEDFEEVTALVAENSDNSLEERVALRQALLKLPANYQEIILLRFVEGLQFNEIAQLQNQSLEATKSTFRRAISALQSQWENKNA